MLVAELLGLAVLVAAHVASMRRQAKFFEDRVKAQDEAEEGRRVALYRQQKAAQRAVSQSDRAVRKMVDQTRSLHDSIRLQHERVDRHFAHPNVKRLVNEGGESDSR